MTDLPLTREALCHAVRGGSTFKYVHFWGHKPNRDGTVGKGCLSQWWPAPFVVNGDVYRSAEHYMMAGKAALFGDDAMRTAIPDAESPGEAKKLGRRVSPFDQAQWEAQRFAIVVEGNVAKFGQHEELGAFLKATANRVLVEASPRDRIWGIGMGASNPAAENPCEWRGLNLLGFALMASRSRLLAG